MSSNVLIKETAYSLLKKGRSRESVMRTCINKFNNDGVNVDSIPEIVDLVIAELKRGGRDSIK